MMKRVSMLVAVAVGLGMLTSPAFAGTMRDQTMSMAPGGMTMIDGQLIDAYGPEQSRKPWEVKQERDKLAAASAVYDAVAAGGSRGKALELSRQYTTTYGSVDNSTSQVGLAAPTSKTLPLNFVAQIKGTYCGPAAGYMILTSPRAFNSKWNGAAPSQSALATSAHMNTDAAGGTPWASGRFRLGLNRWRGDTYYVDTAKPTAAQLRTAAIWDIGQHNLAFGVDTVELPTGPHYNSHYSPIPIGHWIAAYAYKMDSGFDHIWYADPGYPYLGGRFYFGAPIESFAASYLTVSYGNGMTW